MISCHWIILSILLSEPRKNGGADKGISCICKITSKRVKTTERGLGRKKDQGEWRKRTQVGGEGGAGGERRGGEGGLGN